MPLAGVVGRVDSSSGPRVLVEPTATMMRFEQPGTRPAHPREDHDHRAHAHPPGSATRRAGDRGQPGDRQGHRRPSGPRRVRRGDRRPHPERGRVPGALLHRVRVGHLATARLARRHGGPGGRRGKAGAPRLPRPARPDVPRFGRGDGARAVGTDRRAGEQRSLRGAGPHGPTARHPGRTPRPPPGGQRDGSGDPGQAGAAFHGRAGRRRGDQPGVEFGGDGPAEARRERRVGSRLRHVEGCAPSHRRPGGRGAR